MDYKVTFADGSEAFAHSGVKGMKWGVWNAETAARYGRKGGTKHKHGLSPTQKALIVAAGTTAVAVGVATGARVVGTMLGGPAVGVAAGRGAGTFTRSVSRILADKYDIPSLYEVALNQDNISAGMSALRDLVGSDSHDSSSNHTNLAAVDARHK